MQPILSSCWESAKKDTLQTILLGRYGMVMTSNPELPHTQFCQFEILSFFSFLFLSTAEEHVIVIINFV